MLLLWLGSVSAQSCTDLQISAELLLENVIQACKSVHQADFTMFMEERIQADWYQSEIEVQLITAPLDIKITGVSPDEGVKVFYREGHNNNKAIVKPNGFPWVNVSLNPFSNLMRKNKHHTILSIGFQSSAAILENVLLQNLREESFTLSCNGVVSEEGQTYYQLIIEDPGFTYEKYRFTQSINLINFAAENALHEYLIREHNDVKFSFEPKAGTEIEIPSSYAKRIELLIDMKTYLPIIQKIYDDQGLFEVYRFSNLEVKKSKERTVKLEKY